MKTHTQIQNKSLVTLVFLLYTLFCVSQTTQTFNTSGNFSITIPAGVTQVTIDAYGGGGGGGSSNNSSFSGGSGGGSGAYAKGIHTVTSGSTYWYTVGSGGSGGPANSTTAPTAGTSSWFNATPSTNSAPSTNALGTLAIFGGAGVNNSTATPSNRGNSSSSLGNNATNNGNNGVAGTNSGGGNGGACAPPNSSPGGTGSTSTNGGNGSVAGAGGGGSDDTAASKGGNGASGQIAITWTCPTYALTSAATATGPLCGISTSIVTLRSTSLTSGTYTVTYNLTGATTATGITATMTFTSGSPGTGTFTTPSLNIGTTGITVTNLSSFSACSTTISSNNTASVTVNPNLPASVSISASATTICAGTNVTFTATPTNGGTTPTYQWKINGVNVATGATYSSTTLANNDVVTCVMTSNATPCLTGSPATSNSLTMTVASPMTVAAGTTITTCSTDGAVNITAGSNATNQTLVTWTSSGTGTFANANSLTTCTYTPSVADITAGTVTLTLTASNSVCSDVTSTKTLTINNAATVVAGTAINTCSSSGAVNITAGSSATNYTSIVWTSSGTGIFTNANSLTTCTYDPSIADITAGNVTLTLTATGNTPCGDVSSTKTLIISGVMTAIAGTNVTTCSSSGAVNITAGSSATNQTSIAWTSSGTGTFANANSLTTCTYAPSVADITAGSVTLTLTASNSGCADVVDTKTLIIIAPTTAVAGTDINTCASSGDINITAGSSATNQTNITWASSGTGIFTNANSLTTCSYDPSVADITAGSVTLTLTASNAGCSTTSTKTLTIFSLPTSNAGTAINTCSTSGAVNITAGSSATNQTSITWSSSGTGTFTNANSLTTCTYDPSVTDITAGSVTLTLSVSNAGCSTVATSSKTLTISKAMTAVAGTSINTCSSSGAVNITVGSSATNQTSITWTSSGTGTFTNANSLTTCTYNPSVADITAGSVTLTLTALNAGCSNVTSTKSLTISKPMTAVAGTAINTCSSSGAINITAGSSATNQTNITWTSSGTGIFTNANSLTTCTYDPSVADITAGNVTLTLTALNAGCSNVTSTKTITISKAMTAVAGTTISTCSSSGAINITAGSSATNQTSITWTSSGTGTFTNANSLTTCTYNPSVADITAGSVTLTLTALNAGCSNVTSTKSLIISKPMTAVAGTAINTCSSSGAINITAGSSATNQTSITWTSSGTGIFTNANSLTTCTYDPSVADITAGSVTLTLTASNAGCSNVTSTKTITISKVMTAVAGTTISTCSSSGAINITAGSSATNQTSITWTSSGTGTFTNANSLTTCTYNPSVADITAGSVTLTLTASNASCANEISNKTLIIYTSPTITGTTPASRTGVGTVILGATASIGTIYWYAASTGGTSLGFGTSFSTPSISTTTTYYVEAVNGICISSPRVAVVATVNYPEMDIQGNATSIADGDTTPSTADWTDFGTTNLTRTFTIKNTGAGVLTLGAITISGTNASEFTVTTAPGSPISSGSSTTFIVTFNPTATGTRTANISISNNDTDENPYDFSVQGTGVAQEINVQGNATSIVDGDTTPSTTDWTDFSTVAATRTFTIQNTGNIALTIGAITIDGVDAADFSVTTAPSATIAAYGSTTFVVTFIPSAINTRTATIHIANNDADENTYDYAIQGFGIIPEIDIQGNSTSIVDGDTTPSTTDWTDFSTTNVTRTFTIFNQGNTTLTIGAITFTGTNAADFSVTTAPSSSVAAFGSTTFTVTFSASSAAAETATIHIVNNDSTGGENPFDFDIKGTGVAREIDVQGNATSITDGDTNASTTDWTDFSSATYTRTFTIQNTGNMPLTIGAITFVGGNTGDFAVTTSPSATVGAFGSTTFVVTFTPSSSGTRSTTINIVNNDSNENPYNFKIQGFGGTPEINIISQYNVSIVDGDTTPSTTDQTDVGTVSIENGSVTVNLTIQNTGTGALTIGTASFSGTNASDFSIATAPSTTIAAGGTSKFQISFNPTTKGTKTATFSIVNNDSNENPYNFDLTGLGVQTYTDTDGDGITDNDDLDDDNDGINDIKEQTDGLAYPLTGLVQYTFLNETFGTGTTKGLININTPGATCTYCYENGYGSTCDAAVTLEDGEYCVNYKITGTVASDPENIHGDLAWYDGLDHTTGDTNGRMAIFNASYAAGTFYETQIDGVIPNVSISYDFWVLNIMRQSNFSGSILPNITVEFLDLSNNLISSFSTGDIGRCSSTSTDNTCTTSNWLHFSTSVNLGNITSFIVRFKNNSTGGGGNDLAIDDINITQNYIDTDGDGIANIFDLDDENDGIPDVEEAGFKAYSNGLSKIDITAGTWADTNGNGLNDAIDTMISGGTYSIADTDGDLVPNYLDLDSDNDSFFDVDEAGIYNGDGDINGDGRGDLVDTDKDGILDLYDNNTGFGTTTRAYATDTDSNSVADYLQLDSNNDGTKDIKNGLYSSLDANNDGIIDGSTDADKDGILDTFDTNTLVIGSPRDLNRKLFLDFDGRNDYAENVTLLGGLANATLMAWIDLNTAFSTDGVVVGQDKFQIRVNSSKKLEAIVNGTTLTYNTTALTTSQWYHVAATYGGGSLNLYLNGKLVATQTISGNIATDASKLTLGRNPLGSSNYFKGKIDEVRVFNTALTATQVQRMVYQEIQNTASQVRGLIVPKDVGSLAFSNVLRYYRMDTYKDDIVDDLTTTSIDTGTGMKLYNHKVINIQQAPMPFVTLRTGSFSSAVNDTTNDIRGLDVLDLDYSIIQVKHDITETSNSTDLGMIVDSGINIIMNNDTKIQNDWYLKLDGKIDLVGKSQLVQTTQSELDVTSSGSIERDQQGQSNLYNYNYWCSPTSPVNTVSNNNDYTIDEVLRDGTNPTNPIKINWITPYNGAPTSPISISTHWLYKFDNYSNAYSNWYKITETSPLRVGQGYTMKGSGTASPTQNLTFVGKPNSGTITTNTVSPDQLLLTGNPYPSALDADQFINDNSSSIDGTLYFWEHYSSNNTHILFDYQGGYATRNLTGGVMATSSDVDYISKLGTPSKGIPNQYIPVGQGFFVNGKIGGGGIVTFNNGQRKFEKEDTAGVSNPLFKMTSTSNKTSGNNLNNNTNDPIEVNNFKKIRLGFNSNNGYHRQVLLGFMNEKATSGMDYGYDGLNLDDIPNDMYFLNGENQLVIQGEGFFDYNASYPIGIKIDEEGEISFIIDDLENFDNDQSIFIYDKLTDTYHDIRNEKFKVNVPSGIDDNRFSLRFTNKTLKINNNTINDIQVKHIQNNNMIVINNNLLDVTVEKVILFDILGQSIANWKVENQEQQNIQIPIKGISSGVYIAKIKTSNGSVSKKIIIK